jgi:hypothetical protein
MSFTSWLRSLRSDPAPGRGKRTHRRRGSARVATRPLNVEVLEDRLTPSFTWNYPVSGYGMGGTPPTSGPATADFNGDGWSDTATLNYDTHTVSLLLSNGDGTFSDAGIVANPGSVASVAAGDFTSDGIPDLLVSGWSELAVLPSHGDGTFAAPIRSFVAAGTRLAVADFNGDSRPDVFVVGIDASVCLGRGDGTFDYAQTVIVIGYEPVPDIEIGDFNGDARPDVAAAYYDYELSEWMVSVGLNAGDWGWGPYLFFSDATVTEGNTGTANATFTLSLANASNRDLTFHYATADDSATAGSDYQAASGTLTIRAGQTTGTITVLVNGDSLPEPNEYFSVYVSSPTNAGITIGSGTGAIVDDEPRISIGDVTVMEGNTGTASASFTVLLDAASAQSITVAYETGDGTATAGNDYQTASGTLTFAPGETSRTITVQGIGDRLPEPKETFFVNLSSPTNATIGDGQGVGTIVDDEPRISISDVTKKEGNGKKTTLFVFTVTLSAAYDQAVTMSFRTVNGTATTGDNDYIAKSGTLTFVPGETTKTISIEVKGDSKREANETFYLDLFGNSSNSLFTKNRGIGTILNDD